MALYRHVCMGTFPGEEWIFTLHTTGTPSLDAAQTAWSNAISALWTGELDAVVATNVEVNEVTTASIDEATDKQLSRLSSSLSLPGVATAVSLPPQVATVVSLRSTTATRRGRGRMYLPPLASSAVAAGRLSGAAQGAVVAAAKAMFDSLTGAGLTPIIRARDLHQSTTVTSFDVGDVFDTQRRRRNKLIEQRQSSPL